MSTPAPGLNPESGKQLNEYLLELRLPAIRRSFGEKARRAEAETLSYEQYLFELKRNWSVRNAAKTVSCACCQESKRCPWKRRWRTSILEAGLPQKAARQMKTLGRTALSLTGKKTCWHSEIRACGKTHLLSALGQGNWIRAGRRVAFTTCVRLVQDLLLAKKNCG